MLLRGSFLWFCDVIKANSHYEFLNETLKDSSHCCAALFCVIVYRFQIFTVFNLSSFWEKEWGRFWKLKINLLNFSILTTVTYFHWFTFVACLVDDIELLIFAKMADIDISNTWRVRDEPLSLVSQKLTALEAYYARVSFPSSRRFRARSRVLFPWQSRLLAV